MNSQETMCSEFDYRNSKLADISKSTISYADKFERSHTLAEACGLSDNDEVAVCGRIVFKRTFGKFMFVKLQDALGILQVSFSVNELQDRYEFVENYIDVADFIGVRGVIYHTRTGEITVKTLSYTFLSKALRPLPEKWHGLNDTDKIYRQRYLDLVANERSREIFVTRSKIIRFIRNYLDSNGFLEVETPILQNVASGAAARPFMTKHNALDKDYFLRIAPELYLKQAIAGGLDRVYEIGKNFRNEGMDASHLQEFTMLEWYASYWDYKDNISFSRSMLLDLVNFVFGKTIFEIGEHTIDISSEWRYIDYCAEISRLIKSDILSYDDISVLKKQIAKFELLTKEELDKAFSIPTLVDLLYKKQIRPYIINPTILFNYPAFLVPLARRNNDNNKTIDMFQLVICGWEVIKAYSELVNPITQKETFMEQVKNKKLGDDESFAYDEDFVLAMEHGMPPMSGLGMGIDRLVALLCNLPTLRDSILFPLMK